MKYVSKKYQGIEGYCNLIKGYQIIEKIIPSKSDINNSIRLYK